MTPLVTIERLDKSFPGVQALKQARFELLPGEVHALMGENGAGKSTLMKILAGIYRKDAGEIRMEGVPVEIASPRAAQDLGISIIHQELNLMNDLTAAQNIFIGREPKRAFGLLLEVMVFRHLYDRDHLAQVLATFGVILFLNEAVKLVWGTAPLQVPMPALLQGGIALMPGLQYPVYRLAILAAGLGTALLLWLLVERTRAGALLRAGAYRGRHHAGRTAA